MPNLNRVEIEGHLGGDPELRHTQNGTPVASCRIATSDKRGQAEETEWHNVVIWKNKAEEIAQVAKRGDAVRVVGKLKTRKWTDRNNIERSVSEIHAFSFWHRPKSENPPQNYQPQNAQQYEQSEQFDSNPSMDDIPF